jgi:hypothetical protein
MRYSFLKAEEDRGERGSLSAYHSRPSANPSSLQPRVYLQPFNPYRPTGDTSHAVSYCCKLFVVAKKLNSFAIKQIHTLLTKHPGWVYLCDDSALSAPQRYPLPLFLSPGCAALPRELTHVFYGRLRALYLPLESTLAKVYENKRL